MVEKINAAKAGNCENADGMSKQSIANRRVRYGKFMENPEVRPMFSEEEFTALDNMEQYTTVLRWKCLKCGNEFDACLD